MSGNALATSRAATLSSCEHSSSDRIALPARLNAPRRRLWTQPEHEHRSDARQQNPLATAMFITSSAMVSFAASSASSVLGMGTFRRSRS